MNLEQEFVPYQEALELRELGFDEPCFGEYRQWDGRRPWLQLYQELDQTLVVSSYTVEALAPTFSQAFKWFREKYGLYTHIVPEFYKDGINFNWQLLWYLPKDKWTSRNVSNGTMFYGDNGEYPTYEEAELGCLRKLIEIVKIK